MTSLPLYLNASLRHIETRHAADSLMQRAGLAAAEWAAPLARENEPSHPGSGRPRQQWRRCLRNGPPAARAILRCLPGFCRRGQQTAARCRSCLPRFHCRWRHPFCRHSGRHPVVLDCRWPVRHRPGPGTGRSLRPVDRQRQPPGRARLLPLACPRLPLRPRSRNRCRPVTDHSCQPHPQFHRSQTRPVYGRRPRPLWRSAHRRPGARQRGRMCHRTAGC